MFTLHGGDAQAWLQSHWSLLPGVCSEAPQGLWEERMECRGAPEGQQTLLQTGPHCQGAVSPAPQNAAAASECYPSAGEEMGARPTLD